MSEPLLPPQNEAQRQSREDAAETGRNIVNGVLQAGERGVEVARDAAADTAESVREDGVVETAQNGTRNFFQNIGESLGKIKIPELLGGLGGVGLMWLLSSMFGGGWIGTVAFAALAIPGFLMGRSFGQNTLSGWLGGSDRERTASGTAPARDAASERGNAAPAPETDPLPLGAPIAPSTQFAANSATPPVAGQPPSVNFTEEDVLRVLASNTTTPAARLPVAETQTNAPASRTPHAPRQPAVVIPL